MVARLMSMIVLVVCFAFPASSTTIHVPADRPSIQSGIYIAASGDTVLVAPGTYYGIINFLGRDIVLLSSGGSEVTISDCVGLSRGIYLTQGESAAARIQGFTIRNGREIGSGSYGGAIYIENSSPTLVDLVLEDCETEDKGGALYLKNSSSRIENLKIIGCRTRYRGAGIFIEGGAPEIEGTALINNNCLYGYSGGIYIVDAHLSLISCSIVNNIGLRGTGDAIYLESGELNLDACLVSNNGTDDLSIMSDDPTAIFTATCCNLLSTNHAAVGGTLLDPTGVDGNISQDPLFCDLGSGDFNLHADSPCLPGGNSCGITIGAQIQGCDDPLYFLSGRVVDQEDVGIPGIEIEGLFTQLKSDSEGRYSLHLPEGWSGTLTPISTWHIFEPESLSFEGLLADHPDQDFFSIHPTQVTVPGDFEKIAYAMVYTIDGDTVTVEPGEYIIDQYSSPYFDGKDVLLRSRYGSYQTTLRGESAMGFLFDQQEGPGSVLEGFTLINLGIHCYSGSSPTLTDLVIDGSSLWDYGGALYCTDNSSPFLSNVVFRNNRAIKGGALYCDNGSSPILLDVLFEDNRAPTGGAVFIDDASPRFIDCRFINNVVAPEWIDTTFFPGSGGAVHCHFGSPRFEYCLFTENHTAINFDPGNTYGGAFYIAGGASLTITNCTFYNNWVAELYGSHHGGTIYVDAFSPSVLTNNIISFTAHGGGIYLAGSEYNLEFSCNDVFGNIGGNYTGEFGDQTGINNNFSTNPAFCDADEYEFTLAADSPCLPDHNECGVQIGGFGLGCDAVAVPEDLPPTRFMLSQNHPNPFNPTTEISFVLPTATVVSLQIFDISGRLVQSLTDGTEFQAGIHSLTWSGVDNGGKELASGVYFYRLIAGDFTDTRKMTLLK